MYQADGTTPVASGETVTIGGLTSLGTTSELSTWATSSAGSIGIVTQVRYYNGNFLAVDNVTAEGAKVSDNGVSWSSAGAVQSETDFTDIAYGDGRYVLVGSATFDGSLIECSTDHRAGLPRPSLQEIIVPLHMAMGYLLQSVEFRHRDVLDGVTRIFHCVLGSNDWWTDIVYADGLFVAVSRSGDNVMTSPDGSSWTVRSAAGDNDSWEAITYGNALYVAVRITGLVPMPL